MKFDYLTEMRVPLILFTPLISFILSSSSSSAWTTGREANRHYRTRTWMGGGLGAKRTVDLNVSRRTTSVNPRLGGPFFSFYGICPRFA